jgi:hypothetical protein
MAKQISAMSSVAAELRKHLPPSRIRYGGADDHLLWNDAVDRTPALIVRPHTSGEVAAAVLTA